MKLKKLLPLGVILIMTLLGLFFFLLEETYISKINSNNIDYEYIYKKVDDIDRIGDVLADRIATELSQDSNIIEKPNIKGLWIYAYIPSCMILLIGCLILYNQNKHDVREFERHESTKKVVVFHDKEEK